MATAWDFLRQLEDAKGTKLEPVTLLRGEEPFVETAIKEALRARDFEVDTMDWKERGPSSEVEAACLGLSLFSARKVIWCRRPGPASKWSKEDEARWENIRRAVDGEQIALLVQIPNDKRLKWKHLGEARELELDVGVAARGPWVERMNRRRQAGLTSEKMRFLAQQEAELSQIDSYVELWALGGDAWAERALGFGTRDAAGAMTSANPAFDWVDAMLVGDTVKGLRWLDKLEDDGAEPLQLLALASKSIRILATLEDGGTPQDQPDFLIGKMKGVLRSYPPAKRGRGRRLLEVASDLDRKLKSSAQDPWTLLRRLLH